MAKSFDFSRWRRITMQAVMCGILAGSVAVAALVDSHLHHLQQLLLGSRIVDGPVSFYLPSGWKISAANDGMGSTHKATEDNNLRTVTVIRQRIDQMMPPLQYLYLRGLLEGMEEQDEQRETVTIDNWPGQLFTAGNRHTGLIRMIACVILPTREAITLEMEQPGPLDAADASLFNLLLKDMQITGIPRPTSGVIQFPGVSLTLPGNFQVMPESDPLYTQRHIFWQTPEGKYVTAELIPVFLPDESPVESMQEILAGQELNDDMLEGINWFNAKVSHETPDRWQIDPPDSPNRRAYLLGKPGSQGMLISMHTTDASGDSDLDAAWSDLSGGIHFKPATDIKTLITAGAELSHAFPPRDSIERHFLYSRKGVAEGFIEDSADSNGMPIQQVYLRNWNTSITRINQSWGIQPAMWARAVRSDASQATNGLFVPLIDSSTTVTDAINSTIKFRGLQPLAEQLPLPPNFVLSVRLPDILARAPSGDSAIWTDRFVGCEGDFLLRPIFLAVHRADGFVEVQVNGSGRLSRWYFARNGTLEHADFPGGLTLRPATETEISAAFPGGRLTPTH